MVILWLCTKEGKKGARGKKGRKREGEGKEGGKKEHQNKRKTTRWKDRHRKRQKNRQKEKSKNCLSKSQMTVPACAVPLWNWEMPPEHWAAWPSHAHFPLLHPTGLPHLSHPQEYFSMYLQELLIFPHATGMSWRPQVSISKRQEKSRK